LGLLGHFFVDARAGIWLETTGVNDDVFVTALTTLTIMTISSETRIVCDDGITTFGETVKERGLAYIGASDQGQYGFQIYLSVGI
jgi:hypothetical protein